MVQETASFFQVLFDILLWLIIFLSLKKSFNHPYRVSQLSRLVALLFIVLFCLFSFWGGDYFHYKNAFDNYNLTGNINQESIYKWFYNTFSFSYTILRLAIWGIALIILFYAYNRVSPIFDLPVFIFASCFLPIFSYARVSLAMSIILLGLSFIAKPINSAHLRSKLIGFTLLAVSIFFHKSAPIGVSLAILSLFLLNANKSKIKMLLLFSPLLVLIMQQAFDTFAIIELDDETFISEHYRDNFINIDSSSNKFSIGPFISNQLTRLPVYFIGVLYLVLVWNKGIRQLSIGERAFAAYSFCVTIFALLLSFDMGYNTNVLQYRTLYFAMPADAVFLSSVRRCNLNQSLFKFVFWFSVFCAFYSLIYSAYCAYVR